MSNITYLYNVKINALLSIITLIIFASCAAKSNNYEYELAKQVKDGNREMIISLSEKVDINYNLFNLDKSIYAI